MCVEGVRQMGCVWYLSLNIMRRECASPILGPVWWQETRCPLIREGSFPSSKIMRWQCIQLSLDRDRVWGEDGGRNILLHLSAAFDQTRKATVILCISAGLMKAQLTTLSPSVSLKGYSLRCGPFQVHLDSWSSRNTRLCGVDAVLPPCAIR